MVYWPPTGVTCRASVQWWRIPVANFVPTQVGRIEDLGDTIAYAYPSIAVNQFNDVMIGYSRFAYTQHVSGNYAFRSGCDGMNFLRADTVLKNGEDAYSKVANNRNRWGDYSSTAVDPVNDTDFWTLQEYARPHSGSLVSGSGRWGVWWGQVAPDVPANDGFANALVITNCQFTNLGTVLRATRESGEPNHAGSTNAPSVWYRWTAPADGFTRLETRSFAPCGGSSLDSVLAVYTGSAVNSLSGVTNRHAINGTNLVFSASGGTTYQICVAGWNGAAHDYSFSLYQTNAPIFSVQPRSWDVFVGSNVTFSAIACGTPDPTYQWRRHGTNLSSVTNIVGATNSDYTMLNVQTNDTGNYSVLASNSLGTATSSIVHLQVYPTQKALLDVWNYITNSYRFTVSGITGANYVVEASTNLINWVAIYTNQTTFTNIDNTVTNYPYRFYRALYQP